MLAARTPTHPAPLLTVRVAVSFVGGTESQYAIPHVDGGTDEFVAWLRPGQPGLPRMTRQTGAGDVAGVAWRASVQTGPWGYCVRVGGSGTCLDVTVFPQLVTGGALANTLTCVPLYTSSGQSTGASVGVIAVPRNVKDVVLKLSDSSRLRMAATVVGVTRVLGYAIPPHLKVVQMLEYGVAGQLLRSGSGSGVTWHC
jgi:hypothetical protein